MIAQIGGQEVTNLYLALVANFVGGLAVTVLWFIVTCFINASRDRTARAAKRETLHFESLRIKSLMEEVLLQIESDSTIYGYDISISTLIAVSRSGLPLNNQAVIEPVITKAVAPIQKTQSLLRRYEIETSGISQAMIGNEEDVEQLKHELKDAIKMSITALDQVVKMAN